MEKNFITFLILTLAIFLTLTKIDLLYNKKLSLKKKLLISIINIIPLLILIFYVIYL